MIVGVKLQGGDALVLPAKRDIPHIELDRGGIVFMVQVGDHLDVECLADAFELLILAAQRPLFLKFAERDMAGGLILEQPDLPQFPPNHLIPFATHEVRHVRVDVGHAAGDRVDQDDPVLCRLEDPAEPNLRVPQLVLVVDALRDVIQRKEDLLRVGDLPRVQEDRARPDDRQGLGDLEVIEKAG